MHKDDIWKNLSGTVCVLGAVLSTIGPINNTTVLNNYDTSSVASYKIIEDKRDTSTSVPYFNYITTNHYVRNTENALMNEAEQLFGEMRDATEDELASVNDYIRSISKKTGGNFFDLC